MTVLGEKLGAEPADRSANVLRIVLGALFLESSMVHPTLLGQHERFPHTRTVYGKCTSDVRGPAQEPYVTCVSSFHYRKTVYIPWYF
jgi:hypothetical protein